MACRGFNFKIMIQDGEDCEEVLEQFSGANLGIPWDTKEDKIHICFEVKTSPKIQKVCTGPPLKPEQVDKL